MRNTTMISLIFAALSLAPPAFAQSEDEKILEPKAGESQPKKQSRADDDMDDEDMDEQVFYSGMGIGRVGSEYDNLGEAINLEGVIGFRIPTAPWFGIELDLAQTIIPGENKPEVGAGCGGLLEPPCPGATADPDEFAMQALGASLALKSTGRFYVTGKYGYRYLLTSIDELNEKRSGTGFGIRVGYRWGRGLSDVELGYRQLGEDVDAISLDFFVRAPRR